MIGAKTRTTWQSSTYPICMIWWRSDKSSPGGSIFSKIFWSLVIQITWLNYPKTVFLEAWGNDIASDSIAWGHVTHSPFAYCIGMGQNCLTKCWKKRFLLRRACIQGTNFYFFLTTPRVIQSTLMMHCESQRWTREKVEPKQSYAMGGTGMEIPLSPNKCSTWAKTR